MYLIKEKQNNFKNNEYIYMNFKNKISKYNFENSKIEIYIFTPNKKSLSLSKKNNTKIIIYISDKHRQNKNIVFSFDYLFYKNKFSSFIKNGNERKNNLSFKYNLIESLIKVNLNLNYKKDISSIEDNIKYNNFFKYKRGNNNVKIKYKSLKYFLNTYTLQKDSYEEMKNCLIKLGKQNIQKLKEQTINIDDNIIYPISYNVDFIDLNKYSENIIINKRKKEGSKRLYKILKICDLF